MPKEESLRRETIKLRLLTSYNSTSSYLLIVTCGDEDPKRKIYINFFTVSKFLCE